MYRFQIFFLSPNHGGWQYILSYLLLLSFSSISDNDDDGHGRDGDDDGNGEGLAVFHGWVMVMGLGNGINSKSGHGGSNIRRWSDPSACYVSYHEHCSSSDLSFSNSDP